MNFPLTSADQNKSFSLSTVTMVFCMADGGKSYVTKNRSDAKRVNAELVAVMRNTLRQVWAVIVHSNISDRAFKY